jgi:hypothetical protein
VTGAVTAGLAARAARLGASTVHEAAGRAEVTIMERLRSGETTLDLLGLPGAADGGVDR